MVAAGSHSLQFPKCTYDDLKSYSVDTASFSKHAVYLWWTLGQVGQQQSG